MVKLTQSLREWLFKNYPDKLPIIMFGHVELFTKEMNAEYLQWCQTYECKEYSHDNYEYKEKNNNE